MRHLTLRPPSQLPTAVLVVAVLTIAVAQLFSAPRNEWLFTGEKAIPYGSEQLRWWLFILPLALGAGTIVAMTLIVSMRAVRGGHRLDVYPVVAIGLLGVVALTGALSLGHQWRLLQQQLKPRPPRALLWIDVFLPDQWSDFSFRLRESPLTPPHLRKGGPGVEGYPGYIPYDPLLLKRVTFVGLTPEEISKLLGPPLPPDQSPYGLTYLMRDRYEWSLASLRFAVENDSQGRAVVVREWLNISRGIE